MHIQLVDFPSATIDLQENKPIIIIISQLSYYTSKSATVQGGKDLYPQIHHSQVLSSLYIYITDIEQWIISWIISWTYHSY